MVLQALAVLPPHPSLSQGPALVEVEALPHSAGAHWKHSVSWNSREILGIRSNFEVPAFCVAWIPITRPLKGFIFVSRDWKCPSHGLGSSLLP